MELNLDGSILRTVLPRLHSKRLGGLQGNLRKIAGMIYGKIVAKKHNFNAISQRNGIPKAKLWQNHIHFYPCTVQMGSVFT